MTANVFSKLPAGAQGELYARSLHATQVLFNNSDFERTTHKLNRLLALRIIANSRLSLTTSTKPYDEDTLFEYAVEMAKYGTPVEWVFPGEAPLPAIPIADHSLGDVGLERMGDISDDLLLTLAQYDSRIKAFGHVEHSVTDINLANSMGFNGSYRKASWEAALGGYLVQGDDFLRLAERVGSITPDLDIEQLKRSVIRQFDWSRRIVPFAAGSYPVVFSPAQVTVLMAPFLACLNGKAFARGISPWKERLGEQLLDSRITLVDDGTLPFATTSVPFDREGVPTRRNVLIDKGIISQLVLDLHTASMLGRESTGNGTLGGPQPHRALLAPGTVSYEELISGIDMGLLVLRSMGAWAGNPYSGNVSGAVSLGLKIEHGQIIGRVKNCMFSVNVFEAFRDRLVGLSTDTCDTWGEIGAPGAQYPYVALDDVVISTK